jgi:ADP-ribose pyrophosphatase YjhB (NUDIX family)
VVAFGIWRFRLSRLAGRLVTRLAAITTFGRMPPFVSVSVLVVEAGRLLVVVDSVRDEPVLPGGHLRWAEDPAKGAEREAHEETGYAVRPAALLGVYAGRDIAGEEGVVRIIYAGEIVGGSLRRSSEGIPRWMPIDSYAKSAARDAPIVRDWLARPRTETSHQ